LSSFTGLFRHTTTSKLTVSYHASVIEPKKHFRSCIVSPGAARQAVAIQWEHAMKIYLLMTLFGILFTAIHLTSAPKQGSKPVSQ
jgi:hypothetical protein